MKRFTFNFKYTEHSTVKHIELHTSSACQQRTDTMQIKCLIWIKLVLLPTPKLNVLCLVSHPAKWRNEEERKRKLWEKAVWGRCSLLFQSHPILVSSNSILRLSLQSYDQYVLQRWFTLLLRTINYTSFTNYWLQAHWTRWWFGKSVCFCNWNVLSSPSSPDNHIAYGNRALCYIRCHKYL